MTINENENKALGESARNIGVAVSVIGIVLMIAGNFIGPEAMLLFFGVGLAVFGLGVLFLVKGKEYGQLYVDKKRSLIKEKDGIVWVWIVALLTWAIMAVAYFALTVVVYMVLDSVEASGYNFPQAYVDNLNLTRTVTEWFLIIMTVGIIGWALINSVRKVDDTYPAY